jgi:hypothetical protein
MFKKIIFTLSVLAMPVLASCATTPAVYSHSDPKQDFSNYKTFAWATNPPMTKGGDYKIPPMSEQALTDAIKENFIAKGYVFSADETSADFSVSFTVGASDEYTTKSIPASYSSNYDNWSWGYNYFPGPRYGSISRRYDPYLGGAGYYNRPRVTQISPARTELRKSVEGSISVNVFDVNNKRPVWHASASKTLSKTEMRTSGKNERAGIDTLLADFPKK